MKARQEGVSGALERLEDRLKDFYLKKDSPKDKLINDDGQLLDQAKDAKDFFTGMKVDSDASLIKKLPNGTYVSAQIFDDAETKAYQAIAAVDKALYSPNAPGDVPQGNLMESIIPQVVKLLFTFSYIAILISLVVSGVYLLIVYDDEEKITKARHMIVYSLVGFAVITFAFAVVTAVTDINFFS